jgi:hypothetical protein
MLELIQEIMHALDTQDLILPNLPHRRRVADLCTKSNGPYFKHADAASHTIRSQRNATPACLDCIERQRLFLQLHNPRMQPSQCLTALMVSDGRPRGSLYEERAGAWE